jgi:enamine deaminase RidA (YjgF/YER057c/UK114 family)
VSIPFEWVRVVGNRILVSGHGPLDPEGKPAGPFGRVPDEVSLEDAQNTAHLTGLAILSAVRQKIGSLDSIEAWLTISGFVQAEPSYAQTTAVLNPISDLLLDVFGSDIGGHARTAIGVAALPLNLPVIVAAEAVLASPR